MTLKVADRVKETCTSPGTGSATLLGAYSGYQSFSSTVGNGNTCYYTIADISGANWEVGVGTYASAGNTLARTTVLSSSNSGSLVNFSSGSQDVFLTYPSEVAAYASNNAAQTSGQVLTSNGNGTAPTWQTPSSGGLSFSPLTYTYTGTLTAPPTIILSTPAPYQAGSSGGAVADYSGKWANTIAFAPINSQLTSFEFTDLQGCIGNLSLALQSNVLTSISLPVLTTVSGVFTFNNPSLTSFSMPVLNVVGSNFNWSSLTSLTSMSFPALTTIGNSLTISTMAALTSMSFPVLTTVGGQFSLSTMAALTSMSFPALTTIGNSLTISTMAALTSMSFPALTVMGGALNPFSMSALTSISIPVLERIGLTITSGTAITITNTVAALTTFTLPSTLLQVGNAGVGVSITSAALNQTSVDSILVRLAALDGTAGTTAFSSRTVTITGTSSTPSATGLAAKATLVARGCTVTTN